MRHVYRYLILTVLGTSYREAALNVLEQIMEYHDAKCRQYEARIRELEQRNAILECIAKHRDGLLDRFIGGMTKDEF